MDSWGLNPSTFQAVGSVAVFIAITGLVLQVMRDRKARNMEAGLRIYFDLRQKWESGYKRWENDWEHILRGTVPFLDLKERHTGEVGRELTNILNWISWMGFMIRKGWIERKLILWGFRSIIQETLRESAYKIKTDMADPSKAPDYWADVLWVAKQREIKVCIAEAAEELIRKWGDPTEQSDQGN